MKNKQLFLYGLFFVPGICKQSGRIKGIDYDGYLKQIITILYGIRIGINGRCIYNWESLYKHVIYACIASSTTQIYHIYNLKMEVSNESILTPKSIYLFVNAILGKFKLINKHECVQVCFFFFFLK